MAGKSTISITFKLDGDGKGFQDLAKDADGLKKVMTSAIVEANRLNKSMINWSQGIQAISAITDIVGDVSGAVSQFSANMKGLQQASILTTQLTGKTGEEMLKLRNSVQAVSEHFGTDFNETLQAANTLAKGFGISIEEAFKLVRDGFVSGANANGDFISTLKEYPRYFKEAGLSAEDFVAISTNAVKQGVFSDKGVDVIKEGNIRIREMTKATADALNNIGLSATEVQESLQNGSKTTFQVMQQVAAKLKELPASSSAVGTAIADIFGGPGEDAGLEYIKTLDGIKLSMETVKAATHGTAEQQEKQIAVQEKIKNGLSGIIDLQKLYGNIQPFVDMTAQAGIAAMSIGSLIKTLRAFNVAQTITTTKNKALNASMLLVGVSTKRTAAVTRILSGAFKSGAYSATALKLAVNGLKIATGIGIAFFALTEIIEHFADKSEEAAKETSRLNEATEAYKEAAAAAKAEIDGEAKKLHDLMTANKDTTEAVEHLNQAYGDVFGQYKTASDWYDVLTKKSGLYAQQIGYEAQARTLATKIAEKQIALEMNAEKQRELQRTGKATEKALRLENYTDVRGKQSTRLAYKDVYTDEMEAERKEAISLRAELSELEKQQGIVNNKLGEIATDMQAANESTVKTTAQLSVNAMTWQQVSDAITATERELKNTTDPAEIKRLRAYNAQLEARKKVLNETLGLEAKESKTPKENNTPVVGDGLIEQLEAKIADARKRLAAATSEAAIEAINKEIEAYQSQLSKYEALGKTIKESVQSGADDNTPIWKADAANLKDIYGNIDILEDKLQTASIAEAAVINQQIKHWSDKAEAIRKAGLAIDEVQEKQGKINFQTFTTAWGSVKGLESGIQGITEALEGNGTAWQKVTAIVDGFIAIYEGISTVIGIINLLNTATTAAAAAKTAEGAATSATATAQTVQIGTAEASALAQAPVIAANKAATASYTQLAASMYMAAHAEIPFVGFAIGAGFATSATALVQAIGAMPFAEGGVIYGPTLGLMGEYAGASNNPEIVAPLDKLRGMLQPANDFPSGKVRFVIDGRTLVGVLERESNVRKRS